MVWCILLPASDLAPGEKQLQDVRFKALSWSLLDTAVCDLKKKTGTWKTSNLSVILLSHISSCYYFKLYSFILISIRIITNFHTVSYHNNIRLFSFLILRFYHFHCLQVFSHPQIHLKTGLRVPWPSMSGPLLSIEGDG